MALISTYCNVSVMPVRSEPSHRAEQVTQLLYGEKALRLDLSNKEWVRIRCVNDGYEGWCRQSQLGDLPVKTFKKPLKQLIGNHNGKVVFDESEMQIPLGSELISLKKEPLDPDQSTGKYRGKKINLLKTQLTPENLKAAAIQYLHAPYQWGGRSLAGIDCSGLSQMAYKLCNYQIPRDASQQAEKGILVDFLQNAQCGDLAFFDNKDGVIVHVGMLIDSQHIIHATDTSGRVVIDRIDPAGIISISLKKRTHNLRFVKRIIGSQVVEEKPKKVTPTFLL